MFWAMASVTVAALAYAWWCNYDAERDRGARVRAQVRAALAEHQAEEWRKTALAAGDAATSIAAKYASAHAALALLAKRSTGTDN